MDMPRCSTPRLQGIVDSLMQVVAPKVGTALDDLSYVLVENCMALQGGNPAIYLNSLKVQERVVGWVNRAKIGVIDAVQGNSVAVNNSKMDDIPLLYGVLLHESAHAWAEKCGFANTEKNAYLFEIQWVCALAAAPMHPLAADMRAGLAAYFQSRMPQFQKEAGVVGHLQWTMQRHGFA
jgi:hypothetical protein